MRTSLKVCFVGLGSIATRHIRNLKDLYCEKITIDALRSGKNIEPDNQNKMFINRIYYDYSELPDDYDVIFITNPTKLHYDTLKNCQKYGKHFFIEKPVFETGEEDLERLQCKEGSIYYVACPLRYTGVIEYLKENINFSKIHSVRCISSSYLPEWRPGTDYRTTYSAKKELGGGVAIDLIHEWDYLCYLLGQPQRVLTLMGKKSNLEINSEDIAVYVAEYPDKFVELHLDYFGRVPIRKIELYGEDDLIEADLIKQSILFRKENRCITFNHLRDTYQKKELIHFFDILDGKYSNDNTLSQACEILKIARGDYNEYFIYNMRQSRIKRI
ncbi:MAG: Gfo/Idh/MocA family oxidoreductase [Lachnospiraceae bacterium]|nr:Gfo/Idh/MocA family oxidoreductase [Lachnospiraceae bacterium]